MRLLPRIKFDKKIIIKCQKKFLEVETIDLSLFGVKIKDKIKECIDKENEIIINLDREITLKGKILRREENEYLILFLDEPEILASTIGRYLTQKIYESKKCPFCSNQIEINEKYCKKCGMILDYTKPDIIKFLKDFKIGKFFFSFIKESCEEKLEEKTEIIGKSKEMQKIFQLINKYAVIDYPVLIIGETGTGKELIARAIHQKSKRSKNPFVAVNCAAIPSELLESELFGYEKGAFTGADKRKIGKIEYANGGTLFLDEIGDMPLNMQAKILRFLEDFSFSRIGGNEVIYADIRIIAATNVDLKKAVKEGKFREDLYYRLNVLTINLPPLRKRKEDILILANYFLNKYSKEIGKEILGFSKEAEEILLNYNWPGNVRELLHVVKKAIVLTENKIIQPDDLNLEINYLKDINLNMHLKELSSLNLKENIEKIEKELLKKALILSHGNISKAAHILGISRPKIYLLLEKYQIGEIN